MKELDVITLHPTWAWCVVFGSKDVENRLWKPNAIVRRLHENREPFAIHAGALRSRKEYETTVHVAGRIDPKMKIPDFEAIPRGVLLGTARIEKLWDPRDFRLHRPVLEAFEFRWLFAGHWGWKLIDRTPLDPPVPAKGKQGFWKWRGEQA